jgi:uncharacterized repeat protein (TIGR03803 family)
VTNEPESSASILLGSPRRMALALALFCALTMIAKQPVQAQTFTVLHNFTGASDGAGPEGTLIVDRGGNFYGTTYGGGMGHGTVFKLSHRGSDWIVTRLYAFHGQDGSGPQLGLIFGPDGTLYGTTAQGGVNYLGNIYNLRPPATACMSVSCPWSETTLYSFAGSDSQDPTGALIFDQSGNLYGTAFGSDFSDRHRPGYDPGSVWELVHSGGTWTSKVLFDFTSGYGQNPAGGVIFDQSGNLYGTTFNGGDEGTGTVFELTPSQSGWTDQTLHIFGSMGDAPQAGLTADQAGNMYGATYVTGYAFELAPSGGGWSFSTISVLNSYFGPYSNLTIDAQGNLYGTTVQGGHGLGSVFKLTQSNGVWTFTDLYEFTGGGDGEYPSGSVTLDANGNIYGTALEGGTFGYGTVWQIAP